ncbi:hypothetical protein NQZ68_022837, partial [Dissostichus eleginoides]
SPINAERYRSAYLLRSIQLHYLATTSMEGKYYASCDAGRCSEHAAKLRNSVQFHRGECRTPAWQVGKLPNDKLTGTATTTDKLKPVTREQRNDREDVSSRAGRKKMAAMGRDRGQRLALKSGARCMHHPMGAVSCVQPAPS